MNTIYFDHKELRTEKKHSTDAGYDLKTRKTVFLEPGKVTVIETGAYVELDEGWFGKIEGRSSMNIKGIISVGGVIDSDYRGEIKVGLLNTTNQRVILDSYDRIAQLIIQPCDIDVSIRIGKPEIDTGRGTAGFGSTGK